MNAQLLDLVRQLRASGFAEVAGARASVTLPVADRLVADLARQAIPATAPIRDLELRAIDGDRLTVRIRLAKPAFLPPVAITFQIVGQPALAEHAVLVLRAVSGGAMLSLASSALKFVGSLPPGVRLDRDIVAIDLRALAAQHGAAEAFGFVEHLELHTEPGRFVVVARAGVPAR